ncbi:MAG: PhoH family protein [Candidatus Omnitrophota bacterium]|nr:MAG: PhoH family protein [Candidatus Omnitrophota bacterium]
MGRLIEVNNSAILKEVCGVADKNIKIIEKKFHVNIYLRDKGIYIEGEKKRVEEASRVIGKLISLLKEGVSLREEDISSLFFSSKDEEILKIEVPSIKRKFILPKTEGQKKYVEAIRKYDITFAIGPAGTGKTYLAMACAVNYLYKQKARRIILTRPAIEAGESLGFLPGDMYDKLGPYLRPLYDALYDMMEPDVIEEYLGTGIIEIAPLAYMRGRTLNDAFIILDEAQNCTSEQLKMFLTRLGFDSKTVITGDITQSDLPGGKPAGLKEAIKILRHISGIKFIYLTKKDVVRHPLVQKIIQAYEDFYQEEKI